MARLLITNSPTKTPSLKSESGAEFTSRPTSRRWAIAVLALLVGFVAWVSPTAAAELSFPFETQVPGDGEAGAGAGELANPRGIAASPVDQHVYVAEIINRRVSVFTAWGEFVRAFGWGVEDGGEELQSCTTASGCQAGSTGSGPGQFGAVPATTQYVGPTGIAIDSGGDVWVMDLGNFRLQKFDSEGEFILMVGGGVNETTGENVCTAASGDICGAGEVGTDPGEFSIENVSGAVGDYLDVGPDDTLYVGDKDRIQTFEPDGSFKSSFPLPEPGNPGSLAIDPNDGTVYFAFNQVFGHGQSEQPNVYALSPDGELLKTTLPLQKPKAIAVDVGGDVYVISAPIGNESWVVVKFAPDGTPLGEFGDTGDSIGGIGLRGLATGVVTETGESDIYVSRTLGGSAAVAAYRIYGAVPDPAVVGPPPLVAPEVTDQYAASVSSTEATLRAAINPRFWDDTTYHLEYGTVDCETGPCQSKPAPPGSKLTDKVTSSPQPTAGVFIAGLEPDTTYHYRFVAQSGGGPVFGPDRTFTTAPVPPDPRSDCPNQAYRTGPGAFLPDCRAYEMVSPVDKNNADIITLRSVTAGNFPARLQQARPDGGKLTYSAFKAFADPISSPYTSQYIATRGGGGWESRSISPPRSGPTLLEASALDSQFKAVSADLCSGWFLQDTANKLAPEAVDGYPNLYRASLCVEPSAYEAITRVEPPAQEPSKYLIETQGQGGGHTVFRANDKLTPNAPAGAATKVYDYHEGALSYVCILPGGAAVSTGCSAGAGSSGKLHNAVSADGGRIFWSPTEGAGAGKLYLRSNATETIAISKAGAQFWGAAADGSRAIFSEGEDLFEFEVGVDAPEAGEPIAGEVAGVAGINEDASRVYLVSREALDGAAQAGEPNLYLSEAGSFTFVAELSEGDAGGAFSSVASQPFRHSARTSPDGGALAFISNNALSGQDNRALESGEAVFQVYLYDAAEGQLRCASCNATGARPMGRDINGMIRLLSPVWASAFIPTTESESQLYVSRALTNDGRRLYFNSFDSLVARDTNEALDVYQWEAEGKGDCEDPGGCVSLISSGESPQGSEFVDASASGSDVFFSTQSSLLAQDHGLIDIYDARVGGGFAPPPPPEPECQGEACQAPFRAPEPPTPASAAFRGPGNPVAGRSTRACNRAARAAKRLSRRAKRLRRGARAATAPRALRRKRARAARRSARAAKRVSANAKRCRARARTANKRGRR